MDGRESCLAEGSEGRTAEQSNGGFEVVLGCGGWC